MSKFWASSRRRGRCLSLLLVCSCQSSVEPDSFGLSTVVDMEMSAEKQSVMDTGAYTKSSVSVTIRINGEPFRARVSYAGATQVDALKRSYSIELSAPFRGRTRYRLSAMNGDPSALRAQLSFRAFSALGFYVPESEPVAVWIEGEYGGLFLLLELYDDVYFDRHAVDAVQLYQAENGMGDFNSDTSLSVGFSEKLGSSGRADLEVVAALAAASPSDANCEALARVLDLDNVMTYMATATLFDNHDGVDNNYFLLRSSEEPRFRMLPWDLDLTLSAVHRIDDGALFARNALFSRLSARDGCGPSYRESHRRAQERLRKANLSEQAEEMAAQIRTAYDNDWLLSAGKSSLDEHLAALQRFLSESLEKASEDER